ncbi:TcpE family conjugal transfer membrane protein [Nonomuraea sp. WAC 01424]|uniref:TcpE family conjugal transfer membrane protein n=1 Tax=Nonomuraea sp. WAC 01424 TaxID=2203200 RepID=UPI00163B99A7|nr:TcpE family conjugal transfer membrane protein [Nonomuraea sp. WAC 01424]
MDLPTYTNIWRIEKRLYKLYDLRLPMPLPIVWIGVFVGVFVPWSLLLILVGVPVAMPWHVLFLVPPGIVTWLSTRPVIEGKRLTELLESQLRYLGQPKAWYRLAPTAEPEAVSFSGRVWRTTPARVKAKAARKARQPQRRREGQRIAGPRQVRPAVAAAAAAAQQAPVAETRNGWGSRTRRGMAPALSPRAGRAAPAFGRELPLVVVPADETGPASPPVEHDVAAGELASRELTGGALPGRPRHTHAHPASEPDAAAVVQEEQGVREAEGAAEARADGRAGAGAGRASGETRDGRGTVVPIRPEGHKPAPGKPIDTEALRRLRRLAASADAPPATPETPGRSEDERGAAQHRDDAAAHRQEPESTDRRDDGRDDRQDDGRGDDIAIAHGQHRKGQPPKSGPATVIPGTPRVWPPVNPDAKPFSGPTLRLEDQIPKPAEGTPPVEDAPAEVGHPAPEGESPVREDVPGADTNDEPTREPAAQETKAQEAARERQAGGRPGDRAGGFVAPVPVPRPGEGRSGEGRVRRVESVIGRDSGGWRRIAQVVVGGGGVRTDGSEIDEARARAVFGGSRRIVVLGCTGGAGQSTTALMLGHTFASHRDDRVVAVDANTGGTTLTSRIEPETPETLTSLLSGLDQVNGYLTMRGFTTRTASGLEVISADTDAVAAQRLADRSFFSDHRLGESMRLLDRHYKLSVIDPAAALAARILPYADQLVLVVPASEEASEAVAMTYEWLDGHGCAELRRRAVMVVNGVSRRSMGDVEQAEAVARGRCRAIVRVPWEDGLAPGGAEIVDPGQLRAAGRRAYLALAGVVVAGFAVQAHGHSVRPSEEELASDPPGTRIGER